MLAAVRAFPQGIEIHPLTMDFRRLAKNREWYFGTPSGPFAHTGLVLRGNRSAHEQKTKMIFGDL
jgi:hypothetical protein